MISQITENSTDFFLVSFFNDTTNPASYMNDLLVFALHSHLTNEKKESTSSNFPRKKFIHCPKLGKRKKKEEK